MFASTTKLSNESKHPHFALCGSCLWCATVLGSEVINKQADNGIINICPICHKDDLSLMPVAVETLQIVTKHSNNARTARRK
ncbi:MAG TPA: hypothetical protein VIP70_04325 [Nitrososphaeraceae archaeon]